MGLGSVTGFTSSARPQESGPLWGLGRRSPSCIAPALSHLSGHWSALHYLSSKFFQSPLVRWTGSTKLRSLGCLRQIGCPAASSPMQLQRSQSSRSRCPRFLQAAQGQPIGDPTSIPCRISQSEVPPPRLEAPTRRNEAETRRAAAKAPARERDGHSCRGSTAPPARHRRT